jgi:hypothetical protein
MYRYSMKPLLIILALLMVVNPLHSVASGIHSVSGHGESVHLMNIEADGGKAEITGHISPHEKLHNSDDCPTESTCATALGQCVFCGSVFSSVAFHLLSYKQGAFNPQIAEGYESADGSLLYRPPRA